MPSMDFGSPVLVSLSEGQVRVTSIPVSEQGVFAALSLKNRSHLDRVKIQVPDLRVLDLLGVYFDGVAVGEVTVWRSDSVGNLVCLSYWVDEDFYRRGIAFSAVGLVSGFVFEKYGVNIIFAHVSEDNFASLCLMQKLGFVSRYRQFFDTKFGSKLHYVFELERGVYA